MVIGVRLVRATPVAARSPRHLRGGLVEILHTLDLRVNRRRFLAWQRPGRALFSLAVTLATCLIGFDFERPLAWPLCSGGTAGGTVTAIRNATAPMAGGGYTPAMGYPPPMGYTPPKG